MGQARAWPGHRQHVCAIAVLILKAEPTVCFPRLKGFDHSLSAIDHSLCTQKHTETEFLICLGGSWGGGGGGGGCCSLHSAKRTRSVLCQKVWDKVLPITDVHIRAE